MTVTLVVRGTSIRKVPTNRVSTSLAIVVSFDLSSFPYKFKYTAEKHGIYIPRNGQEGLDAPPSLNRLQILIPSQSLQQPHLPMRKSSPHPISKMQDLSRYINSELAEESAKLGLKDNTGILPGWRSGRAPRVPKVVATNESRPAR
ncbi:hypothetical protein OIDMADRAFT_61633 [Oidiodendron maius Zn]|uniref:Uncharacterized protein n=1 Tax=Oidiodendron maius (strain Zn) TaxID=913774 RepID=A0A0C3C3L8_OIDMZ|nr:hypothetical protein OIDMADRAFT_61633 [Oidiodendron maius Zn]